MSVLSCRRLSVPRQQCVKPGLRAIPAADLPAAPLASVACSARTAKSANWLPLQGPRRTATLAALFQTLEATALDDAVELFKRIGHPTSPSQAEEAHSKSRLRSLRDLAAAASMLRDFGHHVVADHEGDLPLAEWKAALFEQIARLDIQAAMASIDSMVTKHDGPGATRSCGRIGGGYAGCSPAC